MDSEDKVVLVTGASAGIASRSPGCFRGKAHGWP